MMQRQYGCILRTVFAPTAEGTQARKHHEPQVYVDNLQDRCSGAKRKNRGILQWIPGIYRNAGIRVRVRVGRSHNHLIKGYLTQGIEKK